MPTQTAPRRPTPESISPADQQTLITDRLRQTRWQVKLVDLATALVTMLAGILAYLMVLSLIDHWILGLTPAMRLAALILLLVGVGGFFVWRVLPPLLYPVNPVYAAQTIEQAAPSLKNSLINYLLLSRRPESVRDSIYQGLRRQAADQLVSVPPETLVDRSRLIHIGYCLAGLLAVAAVYKVLSPKDPIQTAARVVAPFSDIDRPSRIQIGEIKPGDAEIYRGQVLEVVAQIEGLRDADPAYVVYTTNDGQFVDQRIPLAAVGGTEYRARLTTGRDGVQQSLVYRLAAGDAESRAYQLTVLDAPHANVAFVEYVYPRYTALPPRQVEGQGDLSAVEGTRVRIRAEANVELGNAYLEFFAAQDSEATASQVLPMKVDGSVARATYTLLLKPDRETPLAAAYQVRVQTPDGTRNASPARYAIEVLPDLAPEVDVLQPLDHDLELAVNGQLEFEVRAFDPDFATRQLTLHGAVGGTMRLEQTLLENPVTGQVIRKYSIRPQQLGLAPGDVITVWAEAEDNRQSATGAATPNVARTDNYRIRILPAERKTTPNPEESDTSDDTQQSDGQGQNGTRGEADSDASGDGQGEQQSASSGESQEANGDESDASGADASGGADGNESPSEGEQSAGGKSANTGGSGSESSPGGDPADDSTQPGDMPNQGGNESSENQGDTSSTKRGENPSDRGAAEGAQDSSGDDEGDPQGQGTEGQGTNRASSDQTSSDQTSSDSQSNEQNPDRSADADQSSDATADRSPSANGSRDDSTDEPVASDGSNDAEAFERILDHLKDRGAEPSPKSDESSGSPRDEPQGDGAPNPRDQQDPAADQPAPPDSQDRGDPTASDGQDPTGAGDAEAPRDDARRQQDDGTAQPTDGDQGKAGEKPDDGTPKSPGGQTADDRPPPTSDGKSESSETTRDGAASEVRDEPASDPRTGTGDERTDSDRSGFSQAPSGSEGSDGEVAATDDPGDSAADEANLEYAKKATDLALEYLKDQPDDRELLERLGWTRDELDAFVKRWESMRRAAQMPADVQPEARRELNEQLRGLGLDPQATRARRQTVSKDTLRELQQSGGSSAIPVEYLDQYRAFLKSSLVPEEGTQP